MSSDWEQVKGREQVVNVSVTARHSLLQDRVAGATIYFSDQTHSSVERALRVIGFAPDQLRKIQSDSEFKLPLAHLRLAIGEDRARGLQPFCIIANAGTTTLPPRLAVLVIKVASSGKGSSFG